MPAALAKTYEEQMDKPDLVFLNENNIERIKDAIEPALYDEVKKDLELKQAELSAPPSLEVKE